MGNAYLAEIRRELSDAEYDILDDVDIRSPESLYTLVSTFPNLHQLGRAARGGRITR
jgi:hypothetical protein